jgi:hypothetical protein
MRDSRFTSGLRQLARAALSYAVAADDNRGGNRNSFEESRSQIALLSTSLLVSSRGSVPELDRDLKKFLTRFRKRFISYILYVNCTRPQAINRHLILWLGHQERKERLMPAKKAAKKAGGGAKKGGAKKGGSKKK